ncbi:hypothetical protein INT46_005749, partial [Mucor plumbeus]
RISNYPTGNTNPLPTISDNSNKKLQHNLEEETGILSPQLKQEMEYRMRRKIKICLESNDNVGELKKNCQSLKQLERGLVTDAERKANLPATTIQNFLLRYNNKKKTKKREKLQEERGKLQQQQGEASTSTAPEPAAITAPSFDYNHRTFHGSSRALLRQDLSNELRTIFINRLQDNLQNASGYITDYSLPVHEYIGRISFTRILPNGFDFKNTEKRVAPPIPTNSISSGTFTKHFKPLFSTKHLQLIQSTYFGPQGLRSSSLEKYPIYKAFTDVIPRQEDTQPELDVFIMKMALSQFMTNFGNMWNSRTRFKNLFNDLVLVLLRFHLAPRREREKREFIEQEINKTKDKRNARIITTEDIEPIPIDKISLINLTRDQKRNLFDSEQWKDAEDQNLLYNQIKDEKQRRRLLNKEIAHTKSELQKRCQELHQLRNPNKEPTEITKSYTITQENSCCLENAERVSLSDEILYSKNNFFGGTDNGLVNMTETASFDINRFKNHIELHNYYSVLENDDVDNERLSNFFVPLSYTLTINSDDIYHRSGNKSFLKSLERKKKRTMKGQKVLDAEEELSDSQLSEATSSTLGQLTQPYFQYRGLMREFYYSNTITNKRRSKELRRQKFLDQACSNERIFINQGQRGNTIAFVGDRGYSVGSRIKGFNKYSGKWKPQNHSRYISAIITNEYNTSQTCIYCFHKTTHPVHIVDNTLKTNTGTSVCTNPACILVKSGSSYKGRDAISSLAIGLSGFNPSVGHHHTDFTNIATTFLTRSVERLELDELNT